MAQYNVTSDITAIIEAGIRTAEQLLNDRNLSLDYDKRDGSWTANNRRTEGAISELLVQIELRKEQQAAKAAPTREPLATGNQIDYIVSLLSRRTRAGEGGGFMSTQGLYREDGTINRAAIAAMTRRNASALIDSLRGNY